MFQWLHRLSHELKFTPGERRIVLFLTVSFIAGLGLHAYRLMVPRAQVYDYTASDSEFYARTMQPADTGAQHPGAVRKPPADRIIDINTATRDDFIALPGIGPAIADRIVRYRTDHGRFRSVEELQNVRGIGEKKFELLAPLCMVKQ